MLICQIDSAGLVKLLSGLPSGLLFVLLLILFITPVILSVVRIIQNKNTKTEARTTNSLLLRLIEYQENKIRDILSVDGMKKVIQRFYEHSQQDIQGLLADIYIKNNIHDPNRKEIIQHKIKSCVNNAYNRDVADLNGLRHRNKRLNEYMQANINPDILIQKIIDNLFVKKFDSEDMHKYIASCFEKYITDTHKYYENI
jgi:hypothetical protein